MPVAASSSATIDFAGWPEPVPVGEWLAAPPLFFEGFPDLVVGSIKAYCGDSPYFDTAATRALAAQDVARARDIAATLVNYFLIDFAGPVGGGFGDITAPTLVVHGELDPVFPLPHGEALRAAIPGAELLALDKAGHEVPAPLWDVFISALVRHTSGRAAAGVQGW